MVQANRILDRGGVDLSLVGYWIEFDLIDASFNFLGQPKPIAAGAITCNTSSQVMRSIAGITIASNEMRSIDIYNERLRPTICLGDGTRWPLGVFPFSDQIDHLQLGVYPVELTLSDLSDRFKPCLNTISYGAGQSVTGAIQGLMLRLGFRRLDIPSGDGSVIGGVGITWPAGTATYQIVKDLCKLGGFLPGYFDNAGTFVIRRPQLTPDADFTVASQGGKVKAGSIKRRSGVLSAPNLYQVIDTAPKAGPISAIAEVASQLPWSISSRGGFVNPEIIRVQGLTSVEQAQRMASSHAAGSGTGFASVEYDSTVPDPRHDLFQNVAWDGVIYREVEHAFGLQNGVITQHHKLIQGGFTGAN
jgi:hypothetical protein